jgi:hypothetical protein
MASANKGCLHLAGIVVGGDALTGRVGIPAVKPEDNDSDNRNGSQAIYNHG